MDALMPLVAFAVATSGTPGPNVLMVAASAANNGFRATLPHQAGIAFGFAFMLAAVGFGAAAPLAANPGMHAALKWVGAAWLLYLSWKIATAGEARQGERRPPLGFLGAAAFQWVNPKAWSIALSAIPVFTTPGGELVREVGLIALVFFVVCWPLTALWGAFGAAIGAWLSTTARRRAFNVAMGALCALSVVPMLA
jgi:threonine/homoserine/homoserine lactone efflux protein